VVELAVEEYRPYRKLYVDLGIERDNEEYELSGDFIMIEAIDGSLSVRLNDPQHPPINLQKVKTVASPFDRFYLTNSSQPDRSAIIYIGGAAAFQADSGLVTIKDREVEDHYIFTDVSLSQYNSLTDYRIDASSKTKALIQVSSTGRATVYIQYSPDESNWYDLVDENGTPINFQVENEKKAYPIETAGHYMRVVVYANTATTITAVVTLTV